jgi:hypothetical protein
MAYARETGALGTGEPADYVLMALVSLEDPGLTVFATHRLLRAHWATTSRRRQPASTGTPGRSCPLRARRTAPRLHGHRNMEATADIRGNRSAALSGVRLPFGARPQALFRDAGMSAETSRQAARLRRLARRRLRRRRETPRLSAPPRSIRSASHPQARRCRRNPPTSSRSFSPGSSSTRSPERGRRV